jgi:hypothetical protein
MSTSLNVAELDLDEMWLHARSDYQQITGIDLTSMGVLTVNEVLKNIDERKAKDEKAALKHRKAKEVLSKTLQVVSALGAAAAQGAAIVSQVDGCSTA